MDIYEESVQLHAQHHGKLAVQSKVPINNRHDLSLAYTPGVAQVCREIHQDPQKVYDLTLKHNTVAVVSDGSAVLGLGNIGAEASIPVMEGKAILFKEYAGLDAFPICLKTQDTQEIIQIVKNIAPVFAGINLEDIAAPRCFEIEAALQDIGIPVFHDDQHGTAVVLLAALINSAKVAGKKLEDLKVVISGAGAAGTAIVNLLLCQEQDKSVCTSVKEVIVCDSQGAIHKNRSDIQGNSAKMRLAHLTNHSNVLTLEEALVGSDVFIGVSKGNILKSEAVKTMAEKSIILAMANPTPEIDPQLAKEAGAFIIGTGRSDYPNQVNNVLAYPGIFLGAIRARAPRITERMKIEAAYALASCIANPTVDEILPSALDKNVPQVIAKRVEEVYRESMV